MEVFCGIDWAEDHHDIALVDREDLLLARQRIGDDAASLTTFWPCSPTTATTPRTRSPTPSRPRAGC